MTRDDVYVLPVRDQIQELLRQRVFSLQPERDQPQPGGADLEVTVIPDQPLKMFGQRYLRAHVVLDSLHPVRSQHEPELQRAETTPQGNLPVPVLGEFAHLAVLQVYPLHVEGVHQVPRVFDPHGRAVEVH